MTDVTRHEPGSFCWAELATSDSAAAKKFYTSLFGWSFVDSPAGPDMIYTMLKKRDRSVGALYNPGPTQGGAPPHWTTYVAVASADDTAKKAKSLGGKVLAEPFDVMEFGRMATIQDPQGAVFCVWESKKHIGVEIVDEPNTMCWCEVDTSDPASAKRFYTGLFGWGAKDSETYTEIQLGGRSIGGIMKIPKDWGAVPPNWLIYFAVESCDAATRRASELGGQAIVPPTDIPNTGRFSVLRDPQGAVFALFQLAARG